MTKNKRMILSIVLIGYLIILIDNSLVFTCSSQIGASFGMSTSATTWISNGYALTFGSLLLLGGRLGDVLSRKKVFMTGLFIFGISSLLVGLSPSGLFIVITRLIQGCGAAIIAPATLAIIIDNFSGDERNRAIILYGAMSGIGVSLGLIVGAGITTISSWRYGFFINVPISLLLILLTHFFIPERNNQHTTIDYLGALLSFFATALIINGINGIGSKPLSLSVGFGLLMAFIYYEFRVKSPIMPLTIFKSYRRVGAYLIRFVYTGAINSFWFFTPRMLHSFYHFSPIVVGLSFLPMTIINYFSAQLVNKLSQRYSNEKILTVGLIIATAGFIDLCFFTSNSSFMTTIIPAMIIIGFGQGLILSPITTIGVEELPGSLGGVASSIINVMLQLGGALALAIISIISAGFSTVMSFRVQLICCSILGIVSLLIASGFYYIPKARENK